MCAIHEKENGLTDYIGEFSQEELDALKSVVTEADERKKETRIARKALGIHD